MPDNEDLELSGIQEADLAPDAVGESSESREASVFDAKAAKERVKQLKQDRAERKKYAGRIFGLVLVWLIWVGVLLLLYGFLKPRNWFYIPDSVLVVTVGSTTASVVAIFVVVAKYLFPRR